MLAMAEKFKLLYHVLGLRHISHTPRVPVALNAQRTIKIRTHNDVATTAPPLHPTERTKLKTAFGQLFLPPTLLTLVCSDFGPGLPVCCMWQAIRSVASGKLQSFLAPAK